MHATIKKEYQIRFRTTPNGQSRVFVIYDTYEKLQEEWVDIIPTLNDAYDPVEIWVEQRIHTTSIERLQSIYQ